LAKYKQIKVDGLTISLSQNESFETISLTDMIYGEFAIIKDKSGLNSFKISVKEWVNKTNAVGVEAKAGRYGGTYANVDIAFHFAMWISPVFQLHIVREYQRLKKIEQNQYGLEWNVKRILSKVNYLIQTNAVKKYIIPVSKNKDAYIYADEADLLNLVLFNCTAKIWREANPKRALNGENIRDMASINELAVLSNLENLNATLIKNKIEKSKRFKVLKETAKEQKEILDNIDFIKSLKKIDDTTYFDAEGDKKHLT